MKHIDHMSNYFDKEVDLFTSGAGTSFRGILKRVFTNPGMTHGDVVEVVPTEEFGKMFGKTLVNVSDVAAVRLLNK